MIETGMKKYVALSCLLSPTHTKLITGLDSVAWRVEMVLTGAGMQNLPNSINLSLVDND